MLPELLPAIIILLSQLKAGSLTLENRIINNPTKPDMNKVMFIVSPGWKLKYHRRLVLILNKIQANSSKVVGKIVTAQNELLIVEDGFGNNKILKKK